MRKEGYYKVRNESGWIIAEWHDNSWWLTGEEGRRSDFDFLEIGKRINL